MQETLVGHAGEKNWVNRGDMGTTLTTCLPGWLLRVKVLPVKVAVVFTQQICCACRLPGHLGTGSEQWEGKVISMATL